MKTIGISCPAFCATSPVDIINSIKEDFTHWEIFSEADHMVQALDDEFFTAAGESGMTFSLHTAISDTDIAALNPRMREATLMELMTELECAASMDIDTVTIHPGIVSLSVPGTRERSIAVAKESCRLLDRAAREYGIASVCIENMPDLPIMLGVTASELAQIIDGTDLRVTFDIGHAHTSGQIESMVETFGDRIANVHIHDNRGQKDEHLTIGDGDIDFKRVIGMLSGYAGRYIIESKTLESALESQRRLRRMLD